MKPGFGLIWVFLLFSTSHAASIEDIAETAMPSVVQIVVYDITGSQIGQGSGFFITPQKIITNAHVVEKAYSAEVFTNEGYYDLVTILNTEENMDLALLSVDSINEIPIHIDSVAELKPGQRVIAIGNPLGLDKTISDGLISAVRSVNEFQILQITAPVSPGSSGGPLLNEQGHVIGVVSASATEGQNLNFAVGAQTVSNFLELKEQPVKLEVAGSRVLWRVIVKWIGMIILGLIALLFGEGFWLIAIIIMVITFLWYAFSWICKCAYRILMFPFKNRAPASNLVDRKSVAMPVESPVSSSEPLSHTSNVYQDHDADDDNKDAEYELYCWKCGCINYFNSRYDEEFICSSCDTTLTVPTEFNNRD